MSTRRAEADEGRHAEVPGPQRDPDRLAWWEWAVLGAIPVWLAAAMAWVWPAFSREAFQASDSPIDMAFYAYGGELLRNGGMPYLTFWDHKPPLIFFINAVGLTLSGGRVWGVWLMSLVAVLLAFWFGYLALRRALGPTAAVLGGVYFAFSVLSILSVGLTEWYVLPISWAAALVVIRRDPREQSPLALGAALGALGAAALLLRPNLIGGPLSAALVASLLLLSGLHVGAWGRLVAGGVLGAAAVVGPVLVYLAAVGALGAFREQVLDYNFAYVAAGPGWRNRLRTLDKGLLNATSYTSALLPLAGWLVAAYQLWRRGLRDPLAAALALAVIWLPVELLLAAISGREYVHYFTTLYPPLAFLVGYVGHEIGTGSVTLASAHRRQGTVVVVALCTVLAAYTPSRMFWRQRDEKHVAPRVEQISATVAYVRQHVRPGEPVFIWGHAADIYMLSGRRPASRFVYVQPLLTPGYADASRVREFVGELRAAAPAIIVDASARNEAGLWIDGAALTPPLGRWDPTWSYPQVVNPAWKGASYWSMPAEMKGFYDFVAQNYAVADSVGPQRWTVYRRTASSVAQGLQSSHARRGADR